MPGQPPGPRRRRGRRVRRGADDAGCANYDDGEDRCLDKGADQVDAGNAVNNELAARVLRGQRLRAAGLEPDDRRRGAGRVIHADRQSRRDCGGDRPWWGELVAVPAGESRMTPERRGRPGGQPRNDAAQPPGPRRAVIRQEPGWGCARRVGAIGGDEAARNRVTQGGRRVHLQDGHRSAGHRRRDRARVDGARCPRATWCRPSRLPQPPRSRPPGRSRPGPGRAGRGWRSGTPGSATSRESARRPWASACPAPRKAAPPRTST